MEDSGVGDSSAKCIGEAFELAVGDAALRQQRRAEPKRSTNRKAVFSEGLFVQGQVAEPGGGSQCGRNQPRQGRAKPTLGEICAGVDGLAHSASSSGLP